MSFSDYLSVCLCVFTTQKIDLAGGPGTFFNFVWPYQVIATMQHIESYHLGTLHQKHRFTYINY